MKFKQHSLLGFINYHMFWTRLVICKYINNETNKTIGWGIRRIKTAFGHNDKSKIWPEE